MLSAINSFVMDTDTKQFIRWKHRQKERWKELLAGWRITGIIEQTQQNGENLIRRFQKYQI